MEVCSESAEAAEFPIRSTRTLTKTFITITNLAMASDDEMNIDEGNSILYISYYISSNGVEKQLVLEVL